MAASNDALLSILKFKYLTAEYYGRGLAAYSSGAQAFTAGESSVVELLHSHDEGHVRELRRLLGAGAPAAPDPATYDFTAGQVGGGTPFSGALGAEGGVPYTGAEKREFFKLAQLFGDFGARLMIGRVASLTADPAAIETVARMHVTQGRHAAQVRMMRSGANRAPVDQNTTAYASVIAPWIGALYGTGRSYDLGGPLGYAGPESDPTSQAYVATLVYGVGLIGPDALSTEQEAETNQVQAGTGPYGWEAFDEPISEQGAAKFLARFGVPAA